MFTFIDSKFIQTSEPHSAVFGLARGTSLGSEGLQGLNSLTKYKKMPHFGNRLVLVPSLLLPWWKVRQAGAQSKSKGPATQLPLQNLGVERGQGYLGCQGKVQAPQSWDSKELTLWSSGQTLQWTWKGTEAQQSPGYDTGLRLRAQRFFPPHCKAFDSRVCWRHVGHSAVRSGSDPTGVKAAQSCPARKGGGQRPGTVS